MESSALTGMHPVQNLVQLAGQDQNGTADHQPGAVSFLQQSRPVNRKYGASAQAQFTAQVVFQRAQTSFTEKLANFFCGHPFA